MARLQSNFRMLVLFALGYLSCFVYLNSESDEMAVVPDVNVDVASETIAAESCPDSPPPAAALANATESCECHERDPEQQAEQARERLRQRAEECVDDIVKQRMGIPMISPVLARCAMKIVTRHLEHSEADGAGRSVFDYGYDAMDYPPADKMSKQWFYLAAFLPQDTIALPTKRHMPRNLLFLAPPILHRLKALFQSPDLFDYQFAFRVDELLTYATPIGIFDLVGRIVSLVCAAANCSYAKTTFMVLPCTGISDMTDQEVVHKAVQHVLAQGAQRDFGVQALEVDVTSMAVYTYRTCTKEVLKVTVRRLHRRVRKKWCFYPHNGTRYDLHYIQGSPPSLTRTGSQGSEATAVRAKPVVGVAEVLGWGLLRDQREVLTWDMLRFPNFGNASVDSWVVTQGGRMQPMDPLEPDHSHSPVGHHYVDYLRIGMCTFGPIEQGVKFREIYTDSPQGKELIFMSRTKNYKFAKGQIFSAQGSGTWKVRDASTPDVGECEACKECLAFPYAMGAPLGKAQGPCDKCWECQYMRFIGHGMPLARTFVGCTDVEGVMENSVKPWHLCDDTQKGHIPRPSEGKA